MISLYDNKNTSHPILNFVSSLPKELKEEIIDYCSLFSFVLSKTGLFPKVPTIILISSRYNLASWAIRHGYFHLLKWIRKTGLSTNDGALWHKSFYGVDAAIREGNLDILKWLRKKGCILESCDCALAANYGHLEVLKWLHQIGITFNKDYCIWAAGSHSDTIKWIVENKN